MSDEIEHGSEQPGVDDGRVDRARQVADRRAGRRLGYNYPEYSTVVILKRLTEIEAKLDAAIAAMEQTVGAITDIMRTATPGAKVVKK
jgi:hypothetical protein